MMKTFSFVLLGFVLASCVTAEMVKSPNQDAGSQYGPSNQIPYGIIKYLNQGADAVISKRREDALKKMYDSCGGKYEIKEESATFSGQYSSFTTLGNSEYIYIRFECLK